MKLTSIREFRNNLAGFSKKGELVVVMNHGKMVGCFLPLEEVGDIPFELKKEFVTELGRKIASDFASRKVSEKDVLNDFVQFKKNRRG